MLKWTKPHPSQNIIYLPFMITISVFCKFCCGKSVIKWLYPYSTWNLHFCTVSNSSHLQHINSRSCHHTASEMGCKCHLDSGTRLPYMSLLKEVSYINLLKPTGHVMHRQFNIQQLYILPTLYLCVFLFIWEQTATCVTYSINWLVFIIEMKSVYCAVRTGSLNKTVCASYLTF